MKIPTPEEINKKINLKESDILLEIVINELFNSSTLDWYDNFYEINK